MLITWLSDFFRSQRLVRRSNPTAAFVQRLETRCLLTVTAPVVLSIVKPESVSPKLDGTVPDVELTVFGLNFVDDSNAGLKSLVFVNGAEWDTVQLGRNILSAKPRSGFPNGLIWGSNSIAVRNEDADSVVFSDSFAWALPFPKLKVTSFETTPSRILRGQPFVIAVEGDNFTDKTLALIAANVWGANVGPQVLALTRTRILIQGTPNLIAGLHEVSLYDDFNREGVSFEIEIHNPTPVITSVTPTSLVLKSDQVAHLTINGSNFSKRDNFGRGSFVVITPDEMESEFLRIYPQQVTDTKIELFIENYRIERWTGFTVTVINQDTGQEPNEGEPSNEIHVTLPRPEPFITTLSDLFALTGGADKPIQVEGRNFSNPIVRVGSTTLVPENQSAQVLNVTIPAALQTTVGIKTVTVENQDPDGNIVSNAKPFGVVDSSNAIKLSENSKVLNGLGTSLIVDLVNSRPTPTFQPGAVVKWNGVVVGSVGGTEAKSFIAATIPANLMANPEVASITIENANGTVLGPVAYFLKSPRPTRTGVQNIGTVTVGPDAVLTLRGTNFFPGSRVILNGGGPELPTTFTDSQTLVVTIPANRIPLVPATDNRIFSLTVENPAPREGGTPDVWDFRAVFPTPTLTGGSAPVITAGAPLQTIMVSGTGFLDGLTKAYWDDSNVPLTTRFLSDSQLEVDLPASLLAVGGSHLIRVATNKGNGNGLASNQLGLDVLHPKPTLSAIESTWAPTRSSWSALVELIQQ